jgi:hypothetical protein
MTPPAQGPGVPPERRAWERERFLARIRGMSRAEVIALGDAVDALVAEGGDAKKLTRGFFLAWYEGPRLDKEETAELDQLFVDIVVALATGLAGVDPHVMADPGGGRRGAGIAFLAALFPSRGASELTDVSIRLIRGATQPVDPRRAVVAAWNTGCAIALRGRLDAGVEATLTAAWRRGVGDLPV